MGFKNARKSTPYAAEAAAEKLGADALRLGFDKVQRPPARPSQEIAVLSHSNAEMLYGVRSGRTELYGKRCRAGEPANQGPRARQAGCGENVGVHGRYCNKYPGMHADSSQWLPPT